MNKPTLNLHPIRINQVFRKLSEEYFLDSIAPGTRVLNCGCGDGAIPLSFFLPNSPFMNSSFDQKGRDAYARQLAERMADRAVYDFVYWFEKSVVSRLPQSLASQLFVVIAKH